jgi:hypothetical protein
MPKRGSVQLLLLSFRPRATLGWGLGAAVVIVLLTGLMQARDEFPLLAKTGIAQVLRQSAWERALAGPSEPVRWPWDDMSVNMSLAPAANVPRLGLSAAILQHAADAPGAASPGPHRAPKAEAQRGDVALGDVALGEVAVGDSITFTAADGATCVYRVTGRRVVDPHLAGSEAESTDGETSLFSCGPLDRLIIEATKGKPPVAPQSDPDQQKL